MSADPMTIPARTAARTGDWTFTVDNGRGATLTLGMEGAEGAFSPVELLQAALAGCAALSAEAQLVDKLGHGATVTSTVEVTHDAAANRITTLTNHISADMSALAPERRDKLIAAAERSISTLCTVKRSLTHGIDAPTTVAGSSADTRS